MAFDRFQSASLLGSDSVFSSYKQQAFGTGENGMPSLPYTPLPHFSLSEEHPMSYIPWSAQDGPYQRIDCPQNSVKTRSLPDENNCGSETDLYGLVSNILEEAEQKDSYFNEETSSQLKSVWSPKTMRDNCQQYSQSESKMQSNSALLPNHVYSGQPLYRDSEEFYQHFNGLDSSDKEWLNCNGDTEYSLQTTELPKQPGQMLPNVGNTYLSKMRPSKHDYSATENVAGFCGPGNTPSTHTESFVSSICPQSKMNSQYFDHYYENYPGQSTAKTRCTKQYTMQEVSKLANNIQALMAGEQVSPYEREPQNRQSVWMQYDDFIAEQNNDSSSRLPGPSAQDIQFKKELGGEYGAIQFENDKAMKSKQPLIHPQSFNDFQPIKAYSASFNPLSTYQNKMSAQKGCNPMSASMSLNQYSNHHSQQDQLQNKLSQWQPRENGLSSGLSKTLSHSVSEFVPKHSHQQPGDPPPYTQDYGQGNGPGRHSGRTGQNPVWMGHGGVRRGASDDDLEVQLDWNRMHMAGLVADNRCPTLCWDSKTRPQTSTHTRGDRDKKQGLLQNPYLDFLGSMYSAQRFSRVNNTVKPVKKPAFLPYKDPRPNSCHMPLNTVFNYRSFPFGGSVPVMDLCDVLPDGEFAAFNTYLHELMNNSGENPSSGMTAGRRFPKVTRNRGGSMSQLHCHLEECYEQWRALERERKKTEVILTKSYPGKRISVVTSCALPKIPPNPSRVDRLIVDQIREQAKVMSLLGKMERLRSFPLHANICSALDRHLEAIYITQARRKEEFLTTSNRHRQGSAQFRDDRDILLLATALRDLCLTTRKSRTALWCALQMTLPKASTDQSDQQGSVESTCEETSPGQTHIQF
ncbi:hypothetical protein UPYG_G00098480 [Umbra pygmaea]|uniref:Meiosis-specific coiled-coil domain-containing protein MEIOC n=1 Tax=Umbra pygmaea TaxID=75934 RepID=A0ABD0X492_UMBPY